MDKEKWEKHLDSELTSVMRTIKRAEEQALAACEYDKVIRLAALHLAAVTITDDFVNYTGAAANTMESIAGAFIGKAV